MKAKDYQILTLCGFIHNREAFSLYAPDLNEEQFTDPPMEAVYSSMISHGESFTEADLAEAVEPYGGLALIRDIKSAHQRYAMDDIFTNERVRKTSAAVEKLGRLHQIRTLLTTAEQALDEDRVKKIKDDEAYVSSLISNLVSVQYNNNSHSGYRSYNEHLAEYKKRVQALLRGGTLEDRLATPFNSFNEATGGGLPNGLIVIGGLPGAGKTQLAWQMVIGIAQRLKAEGIDKVCAVNSLEMTGVSLASRALLSAAEIDSMMLREGQYNKDREAILRLDREFKKQSNLPIYIDDSDYLTSNMIASRVSGLKARFKNVALVVTDYAELVSDKGENTEQKVSAVFVNSKAMSKRLNCPVILLSQLNRTVEMTGTKVPSMRHIRYAGMAEGAADMIILIYNPNNYISSGIKLTPHAQMPPSSNTSYLILAKHKEGQVGFLPMKWIPQFTRWGDLQSNGKARLASYDA